MLAPEKPTWKNADKSALYAVGAFAKQGLIRKNSCIILRRLGAVGPPMQ